MGCTRSKTFHKNTSLDEFTDIRFVDDHSRKYNTHSLEAIVAMDRLGGIGKKDQLPWKIPKEMEFFKKTTTGHIVIMGSKTFRSLNYKPLKNRLNIVLTNHPQTYAGKVDNNVYTNVLFSSEIDIYRQFQCDSANEWNELYPFLKPDYKIFVIGGSGIYRLLVPKCICIWASMIKKSYSCDTVFPYFENIQREEYKGQLYLKEKEFEVFVFKRSDCLE